MIPSLIGEPFLEEAIIVDTIILGLLELISVSTPNRFITHGGYTSLHFAEDILCSFELVLAVPLYSATFRSFVWHQGLLGSVSGPRDCFLAGLNYDHSILLGSQDFA